MKVLLIKDVYKLGRAGDIKRVAAGYGRNYLLPEGLAILATPGAIKQADKIRAQAEIHRAQLNEELKDLAGQISGLTLSFPVRASETGKLYGSITAKEIAEHIQEKTRFEIKRQQLEMQPIRSLGEHIIGVRLTMDLVPEVRVLVHREGESPESAVEIGEQEPEGLSIAEAVVELEPQTDEEAPAAETAETVEAVEPAVEQSAEETSDETEN
ncbi:MAG: 50S ribosomal protein L9 [Anaerolineales bacterium]|nr:50S ribosomal protein L9 [Anaerolineales bacterium]